MRSFRTSIAGLLVLILFCAIAMAALRSASAAWSLAMVAIASGLIGLAILQAVLRRGPRRSFGAGYAVMALAYLGMSLGLDLRLPTTSLLYRLQRAICPAREESVNLPRNRFDQAYSEWSALHPEIKGPGMKMTPDDPSSVTIIWVVRTREPFVRIGHCLFSVIFGLLGGFFAQMVPAGQEMEAAPRGE